MLIVLNVVFIKQIQNTLSPVYKLWMARDRDR